MMKQLLNEWRKYLKEQAETPAINPSDIAYKAIGLMIEFQAHYPDKTEISNKIIAELQQFMKNPTIKLGSSAQFAYNRVLEENSESIQNYWYNCSKEFQTGGIQAVRAYVEKTYGKKLPPLPEQSNQARPNQEPQTQAYLLKGTLAKQSDGAYIYTTPDNKKVVIPKEEIELSNEDYKNAMEDCKRKKKMLQACATNAEIDKKYAAIKKYAPMAK